MVSYGFLVAIYSGFVSAYGGCGRFGAWGTGDYEGGFVQVFL